MYYEINIMNMYHIIIMKVMKISECENQYISNIEII